MTSEYIRWPDKAGPSRRHFGRAVDRSISFVLSYMLLCLEITVYDQTISSELKYTAYATAEPKVRIMCKYCRTIYCMFYIQSTSSTRVSGYLPCLVLNTFTSKFVAPIPCICNIILNTLCDNKHYP